MQFDCALEKAGDVRRSLSLCCRCLRSFVFGHDGSNGLFDGGRDTLADRASEVQLLRLPLGNQDADGEFLDTAHGDKNEHGNKQQMNSQQKTAKDTRQP